MREQQPHQEQSLPQLNAHGQLLRQDSATQVWQHDSGPGRKSVDSFGAYDDPTAVTTNATSV